MTLVDTLKATRNTKRAARFFSDKMEFTTGPIELSKLMDHPEQFVLIDVRAREDYEKGHIPGAISCPREDWLTCSGLSLTKNNIIYCYSPTCHLSAEAARDFARQGYPVIEMQGGFEGWQKNNLSIES